MFTAPTPAARSLLAFGLYLIGAGVLLMLAPALLLAPVGIAVPRDVWVRMLGLVVLCLGITDVIAARANVLALIGFSVWRRGAAAGVIVAFVVLDLAPTALCLFAGIDAAAALWTAWALRSASEQAASRHRTDARLAGWSMAVATAALAGSAVPTPAQASIVSFDVLVSGVSDIVNVVDPNVPIVAVHTEAAGSGVMNIVSYRSDDVFNLATGRGAGSNTFGSSDGDELYASFTVQLVPGDLGAFSIIGSLQFTGGTGRFGGASGLGSFLGFGQFESATHALTQFDFDGRLILVPLPATVPLLTAGLALLGLVGSTRRPHAQRLSLA